MSDDDIAADLPQRREDEPASLRRDIIDELADHLDCAVARERLAARGEAGLKEASVQQQVFARFGSPARVARGLWWDAMQERIMAQRIPAIMAGTAAAACVIMCVLLWQFVQDSQRSQAAALASMQEFHAGFLDSLAAAQADAEKPAWGNVRLKLVRRRWKGDTGCGCLAPGRTLRHGRGTAHLLEQHYDC